MPDAKLFLSQNAPVSREHTISSLGWISDCVGHGREGFHPDEWAALVHEMETVSTERGEKLYAADLRLQPRSEPYRGRMSALSC